MHYLHSNEISGVGLTSCKMHQGLFRWVVCELLCQTNAPLLPITSSSINFTQWLLLSGALVCVKIGKRYTCHRSVHCTCPLTSKYVLLLLLIDLLVEYHHKNKPIWVHFLLLKQLDATIEVYLMENPGAIPTANVTLEVDPIQNPDVSQFITMLRRIMTL